MMAEPTTFWDNYWDTKKEFTPETRKAKWDAYKQNKASLPLDDKEFYLFSAQIRPHVKLEHALLDSLKEDEALFNQLDQATQRQITDDHTHYKILLNRHTAIQTHSADIAGYPEYARGWLAYCNIYRLLTTFWRLSWRQFWLFARVFGWLDAADKFGQKHVDRSIL